MEFLEKFGIDYVYIMSFRFLNESQSIPYFLIYISVIIATGAWKSILLATCIALFAAVILQRVVFNRRCEIPSNSAILFTGCSTGIGFDSAILLAKKGFHVYATVRKQEHFDNLKEHASVDIRNRLHCVIMDVCKKEQIKEAVATVTESLNSNNLLLQSIVNNAGYAEFTAIETQTEALERQYATNVFGLVNVTNAFLPLLRTTRNQRKFNPKYQGENSSAPPPSLINISSVVGKITVPFLGVYCSSKHAVESISDSYRSELSSFGINTVIIEPGSIKTSFSDTVLKSGEHNAKDEFSTLEHLDSTVCEYYRSANEIFTKSNRDTIKLGQPTIVVSEAIAEAILSPRPLTRYRAGGDSNIIIPLLAAIPDCLVSLVIYFKAKPIRNKYDEDISQQIKQSKKD